MMYHRQLISDSLYKLETSKIVSCSEKRDPWNSSNDQISVILNFLQFSVSQSIWLRLHICGIKVNFLDTYSHNFSGYFLKRGSIHTEIDEWSLFSVQVTVREYLIAGMQVWKPRLKSVRLRHLTASRMQ